MTRQRPWTTDLYQPHTGHISQSVRPDPVWSSLNQPATLLIWTWIERWDWTILIFWFSLTLTSLIPPFLYQSRIPGFEKWPWKVAKPLHHYSCLSSPQRSFELIFSNWQHGFFFSFFRPAVILQELQCVARWRRWKKYHTEVSSEPLFKKKKRKKDITQIPIRVWPALTHYASWDKKVSFIVCDLRDQDKSKLHAQRNTYKHSENQDESLRLWIVLLLVRATHY